MWANDDGILYACTGQPWHDFYDTIIASLLEMIWTGIGILNFKDKNIGIEIKNDK